MNAALEFIVEQLRGVWRFRWTAMLVAWVVCLLGWLIVLVMPDTYSAWARVFVDTRTRLNQVTQGIGVDSNFASEVEAVRQALLGAPQLDKVARAAIRPTPTRRRPARSDHRGRRARLIVEANGERDQPRPLRHHPYRPRCRRAVRNCGAFAATR
jgi:uncharacterized protein involved in exopolysaccharide biosynthesis